METIHLHLTPAQKRKLMQNKTFQMSASQLASNSKDTTAVNVLKKTARKINKCLRDHKGIRFSAKAIDPAQVQGGKLNLGKVMKKVGKVAQSIIKHPITKSI